MTHSNVKMKPMLEDVGMHCVEAGVQLTSGPLVAQESISMRLALGIGGSNQHTTGVLFAFSPVAVPGFHCLCIISLSVCVRCPRSADHAQTARFNILASYTCH